MASLPKATLRAEREMPHPGPVQKASGPVVVPAPLIQSGNLLVRRGTALPEGSGIDLRPFLAGWQIVRQPRATDLERALEREGWTVFQLTASAATGGFGQTWESAVRRALQRLFARVSGSRTNALEIVQVKKRKLLGVRWVRVTARLRHIQEGPYLFSTPRQMAARLQRVAARTTIVQLAGRRLGRAFSERQGL